MVNYNPDYEISPVTLETEKTYFQSVLSSILQAISADAGVFIRHTSKISSTLIAHHNLSLEMSNALLHKYNLILEMETLETIGTFFDLKKFSAMAILDENCKGPYIVFEKVMIVPLESKGNALGNMLFFYKEIVETERLLTALELLRCLISSTVSLLENLEEKLQLQMRLLDVEIQERKRVQDELMLIFDSVPAAIFYKDTKGRILRVNKAHRDYNRIDSIVGKLDTELYSLEAAENFRIDDEEVMIREISKINIIEHIKSAHDEIWVRTDKVCLKNSQDEVIGIIGFSLDISQVKRSEEEVLKLNRFLNNIMENTMYGLLLLVRMMNCKYGIRPRK